jgi:REP element-mobilizing transposase RayT
MFEAKKRFGLCVLNYVVASNHIHLLVQDTGEGIIARSMQLIAGRTGQEYNLAFCLPLARCDRFTALGVRKRQDLVLPTNRGHLN